MNIEALVSFNLIQQFEYSFYIKEVHNQSYVYIHTYMVIDLKVLVRSFNCENRACYVGNPRES